MITEIIDATGDGTGNPLCAPQGIAVDGTGNVYVAGRGTNNAFRITPGGVITEIIDETGDGSGNPLQGTTDVAVDASGNVYVVSSTNDKAFKITPGGVITEIIDETGDGAGSPLSGAYAITVDVSGNVYVAGFDSDNAFQVTPSGVITEIIDFFAGGAGHPPTLDRVLDIAVDGSGNVYVPGVDSDNAFRTCRPLAASEVVRLALPANPGTLLPGAGGPPLIGAVWMPTVTGVPSQVDVVVIDPLGAVINVPTPFGTLLCDNTPPSIFFTGPPGTPLPIPIPADCSLIGQAVCAQGAGVSISPATVSLTNALDLVIGTF